MLALQLQELGYDVHLAYTGRAAVEICTRQRFLACLIDIGLPDIAGTEVAVRLKSALQDDAPMLVGVSGYGQDTDVRLALDAGFDHYFVKPVDLVPLSHLLHDRASRAALTT